MLVTTYTIIENQGVDVSVDSYDFHEVIRKQAEALTEITGIAILSWCDHELTVETHLPRGTIVYTCTGYRQEAARLVLLYSCWSIVHAGPTGAADLQAMDAWWELGSYGWSPDRLLEAVHRGDPMLAMAGMNHERLALLCALGITPKPSYRALFISQIIAAYKESLWRGVAFDDVLSV